MSVQLLESQVSKWYPDTFAGKSDLEIGYITIADLLKNRGWKAPALDKVLSLRPQITDFIDPGIAQKKGADHGQEHDADGLILGLPFWEMLARSYCTLRLPVESMAKAWTIHDKDVIGDTNTLGHGSHVVERFEREGRQITKGNEWSIIRFIVTHHSERVDDQIASETLQHEGIRYRVALAGFQDVDASLLTRSGVDIPISRIALRTDMAKYLRLPYVARVLLEEAKGIHTGDSYIDHTLAACKLGLVKASAAPTT
jgi:hypothetical protein